MGTNEELYVEESGLKLKDVFKFLKRSAVRILIYVLTAVIAMSVIILALRLFMPDTKTASTRIEFTYNGIDQGLTPAKTTFSKESIISIDLITTAINNANLSEKLKDSAEVKNAFSVIPIISDEYKKLIDAAAIEDAAASTTTTARDTLRNYTFHPTKFDVNFIDTEDELKLTKTESINLVDKLIEAYKEKFKKDYGSRSTYSVEIFSKNSDADDFIDYYDLFYNEVSQANSFIQELRAQDSSFRSSETNSSFNDLISDYSYLLKSYAKFSSYIMSEKVAKNMAETRRNLEETKKSLGFELDEYKTIQTSLKEQIKSYPANTVLVEENAGTTKTYIEYPPEYSVLQSSLTSVEATIATINTRIAICDDRLKKFDGATESTDEQKAKANEYLTTVREESKIYTNKVNATITDYYEKTYVQNMIKTVLPTRFAATSDSIPYLMIFVIVIVIAIGVAMIVTQYKIVHLRKIAETQKADS